MLVFYKIQHTGYCLTTRGPIRIRHLGHVTIFARAQKRHTKVIPESDTGNRHPELISHI